jgi:hypothetical protein
MGDVIVNSFVLSFQLGPRQRQGSCNELINAGNNLVVDKYLSKWSRYIIVFFSFLDVNLQEEAATGSSVAPPKRMEGHTNCNDLIQYHHCISMHLNIGHWIGSFVFKE